MDQKLQVEIWADVVCPWCWIGKRRFEEALEAFPFADNIEVSYRSFRLSPGAEPKPVKSTLAERYQLSPQQVEEKLQQVEGVAREAGLQFHLADTQSGDTSKAHQLVQFARGFDRQDDMIERLYQAHFTEKLSVFEDQTLIQLAEDAGLTKEQAQGALVSSELVKLITADEAFVKDLGLSGVPFFLFGRKFAVSGAQPSEHFAAALKEAWADLENTSGPGL